MPFLRFSRDKRGYANTYLCHTFRQDGVVRMRVLYWSRMPPDVGVGRPPLDDDAMREIEASNPGLTFDWKEILKAKPAPPPDRAVVERRERRQRRRGRGGGAAAEAAGSRDQPPTPPAPEAGASAPPAAESDSGSGEDAAAPSGSGRRRRRRRRRGPRNGEGRPPAAEPGSDRT